MSNRESEGPIQVLGNSPQEINDALATITNRLDHLKGLRTANRNRAKPKTLRKRYRAVRRAL